MNWRWWHDGDTYANMKTTQVFIEPVDTLALRGNRLFGAPGSFGESFVPPWPSVAAGALRSALLAQRRYDFAAFGRGEVKDDQLGTPKSPGTFAIANFQLARRHRNGAVEALFAAPADLFVHGERDALAVRRITPRAGLAVLQTSAATQALAVLPVPERTKPISGVLLTANGWRRYLAGGEPSAEHIVSSSSLWQAEPRIGIALDPARRAAEEGALFTSEGVVFAKQEHTRGTSLAEASDAGFLAGVTGATLPDTTTLRFGGDGHAAIANKCVDIDLPTVDYEKLAQAGRCRLILTTPGLFRGGWLPTGATGAGRDIWFRLHGVEGRLVCAAVPRAETMSGFDLAARRPKPAQRVAPTGSVYWLEDLRGSAADLRNLADRGLWSEPVENAARRAEGFNRVAFGVY